MTADGLEPAAPLDVPPTMIDLFVRPILGGLSWHNVRREIVSFPVWVDLDGGRILTSSRVDSTKGGELRADGSVSVLMLDPDDPFRWLAASGKITAILADTDLAFIDRMSRKYEGHDYRNRGPREIFVMTPTRISWCETSADVVRPRLVRG